MGKKGESDVSTDVFQVIQYEVRQGDGEQVFDAAALEDGKITVEVTLHYITLHHITKHWITLRSITLGTG